MVAQNGQIQHLIWYNTEWFRHNTIVKIKMVFVRPTYKLLFGFTIISDVYRFFIPNKTAYTMKFLVSWEIQWVRKYLLNFTGLAGMVKANVSQSDSFFTGLGYDKSLFLTL